MVKESPKQKSIERLKALSVLNKMAKSVFA